MSWPTVPAAMPIGASRALTLRQIYADAPGQGAVVWKMGARGREAAAEVDQIFREILPEAVKRRPLAFPHRSHSQEGFHGRTPRADRRTQTPAAAR